MSRLDPYQYASAKAHQEASMYGDYYADTACVPSFPDRIQRPLPDPKTLRDERGDRYMAFTVSRYEMAAMGRKEAEYHFKTIVEHMRRMGVVGEIATRENPGSHSMTLWGRIDPMCEPVKEEKCAGSGTEEKKTVGRYIKLEEER